MWGKTHIQSALHQVAQDRGRASSQGHHYVFKPGLGLRKASKMLAVAWNWSKQGGNPWGDTCLGLVLQMVPPAPWNLLPLSVAPAISQS